MEILSESERGAIDQYGLHNLSDFMPKKPSAEELNIIQEMFKASVDGELYDPDRFGQYYKPAGLNVGGSNNKAPATTTATATGGDISLRTGFSTATSSALAAAAKSTR